MVEDSEKAGRRKTADGTAPAPNAATGPGSHAGTGKARRCPICERPTVHQYRPFCSRRCAAIDLGHWIDGTYAIPAEAVAEDDQGDAD